MEQRVDLRSVEIAAGRPFGRLPVDLGEVRSTPRSVVESTVRRALLRRRCVVAFSGGRDSAAVLALAVDLARREGLDLPVPVTRLHPRLPETDESEWQRQIVRHLRLEDWERIELDDELDVVGPWARPLLRQHGPLWPPVAHSYVPLWRAAGPGGAVLTGEGGDTVFGPQRSSVLLRVMRRRARPGRVVARALLESCAPRPVRRRALLAASREDRRSAWLRPGAAAAVRRRVVEERLAQPFTWAGSVAWHLGDRGWQEGYRLLDRLALAEDVHLDHPLADPALVAALRPIAGRLGFTSRGDAMAWFVGDLLPDAVVRRTTKARFDRAVFGPHARSFAASWDGRASFEHLVDADALRAEWLADQPTPLTILSLQRAWLDATQETSGR
jgi:hypothetical protein